MRNRQRAASSASRRFIARSGLAGTIAQPCFSPHTNHGERFLGPNLDFCCRRWHPAKNSGVLRIASSVLHILPQTTVAPDSGTPAALMIGQKAAQERFSEESFQRLLFHRKRISQKLCRKFPHTSAGTHSTQQAWVNSRNLLNIATGWKHRQPIFLHPTVEAGESGLGSIPPAFGQLDCHSERDALCLAKHLSEHREVSQLAPRSENNRRVSLRHNNCAFCSPPCQTAHHVRTEPAC